MLRPARDGDQSFEEFVQRAFKAASRVLDCLSVFDSLRRSYPKNWVTIFNKTFGYEASHPDLALYVFATSQNLESFFRFSMNRILFDAKSFLGANKDSFRCDVLDIRGIPIHAPQNDKLFKLDLRGIKHDQHGVSSGQEKNIQSDNSFRATDQRSVFMLLRPASEGRPRSPFSDDSSIPSSKAAGRAESQRTLARDKRRKKLRMIVQKIKALKRRVRGAQSIQERDKLRVLFVAAKGEKRRFIRLIEESRLAKRRRFSSFATIAAGLVAAGQENQENVNPDDGVVLPWQRDRDVSRRLFSQRNGFWCIAAQGKATEFVSASEALKNAILTRDSL